MSGATGIMVVLTLAACAATLDAPLSLGGTGIRKADAVMSAVTATIRMSDACAVLGTSLVRASIAAGETRLRMTAAIWENRRDELADRWVEKRCPVSALPGMAVGAAEVINADERARYRS